MNGNIIEEGLEEGLSWLDNEKVLEIITPEEKAGLIKDYVTNSDDYKIIRKFNAENNSKIYHVIKLS